MLPPISDEQMMWDTLKGYRVVTYSSGTRMWFLNRTLHREAGPAVIGINSVCWYRYGELHREDGPALERANGDKEWYFNGQRHREDGPAIECADGTKHWYVNGREVYKEIKIAG